MYWRLCLSLCLCLSLSVSLCVSVSDSLTVTLSLSISVSVSDSLTVSLSLSVCLSLSLSLCLCLWLSHCVSVSVCLSISVSVSLCLWLSHCVSVCLSISVSVSLSLSLCLCLSLSLCFSNMQFSWLWLSCMVLAWHLHAYYWFCTRLSSLYFSISHSLICGFLLPNHIFLCSVYIHHSGLLYPGSGPPLSLDQGTPVHGWQWKLHMTVANCINNDPSLHYVPHHRNEDLCVSYACPVPRWMSHHRNKECVMLKSMSCWCSIFLHQSEWGFCHIPECETACRVVVWSVICVYIYIKLLFMLCDVS